MLLVMLIVNNWLTNCVSVGYLSYIFITSTGSYLIHFIQTIRIMKLEYEIPQTADLLESNKC